MSHNAQKIDKFKKNVYDQIIFIKDINRKFFENPVEEQV